jgi:hypothetical protein
MQIDIKTFGFATVAVLCLIYAPLLPKVWRLFRENKSVPVPFSPALSHYYFFGRYIYQPNSIPLSLLFMTKGLEYGREMKEMAPSELFRHFGLSIEWVCVYLSPVALLGMAYYHTDAWIYQSSAGALGSTLITAIVVFHGLFSFLCLLIATLGRSHG